MSITDLLPLGIRQLTSTPRIGLTAVLDLSRDPTITDLGAAVHRALVVRNSLLVGGAKPTLRNRAAVKTRTIAREVRLDSLEKILIAERFF